MPQPTPYAREFDFSEHSAGAPSAQQPGVRLDAEFDALQETTDDIRASLDKIQRDDGKLRNGIVTIDSLSPQTRAYMATGHEELSEFAGGLVMAPEAADAREMLELGNVDNTADADKPLSTAAVDALADKASAAALDDLEDRVPFSLDVFGAPSTASAQLAIDALPPEGGTVRVNSDWSVIDPAALVLATNQGVVWELGPEGVLPNGMPGAVITRGYRLQPHESSSATNPRPGAANVRYIVASHVPDVSQANQQDSILYIEGHIPEADVPFAQEFAALRFIMSSKARGTGGNLSADIKGLQGTAICDGGNAKARAVRFTAASINGGDGILTGGIASAHRSGLIPTAAPFNGNGTDVWVSGQAGPYLTGDAGWVAQVGPGIQAAYRMEGFNGKERPQFGLLQGRGALALLPELAVLGLHAGGNGHIVQITKSDTDGTELALWEKSGAIAATAFRSNAAPIGLADNATAAIPLVEPSGFIEVSQVNGSNAYAYFYYRAVGGSLVLDPIKVGAGATTGTGAFPADDSTVKADFYITANTLNIRNRLGATVNFKFRLS